jgi:hypothetical protein
MFTPIHHGVPNADRFRTTNSVAFAPPVLTKVPRKPTFLSADNAFEDLNRGSVVIDAQERARLEDAKQRFVTTTQATYKGPPGYVEGANTQPRLAGMKYDVSFFIAFE